MTATEPTKTEHATNVPFEEALNIVGSGKYTWGLVLCCGLGLTAMGIELFGISAVVAGCTCEFNLTMQQQGIITSLPFTGVILTSYFWGYVADTRGRLLVLTVALCGSFALSALSSLSPNWIVLAVFRFVSVCFSSAVSVVAFTLLGECCPSAVRSRNMLLISIPLMFALALANAIAYPILLLDFDFALPLVGINFVPWRLLLIAMATPCAVCGICLHFFHESPKFLASSGRNEEAVEVLRKMFVANNNARPEEFQVKSVLLGEMAIESKQESLLKSLLEHSTVLFKPPLLGNTLRLLLCQVALYATNSGFVMWSPQLFGALYQALQQGSSGSLTLCQLFSLNKVPTSTNGSMQVTEVCSDQISLNTFVTIVLHGAFVTVASIIVSQLHSRMKTVLITNLLVSGASSVCINFVPNPIAAVVLFTCLTSTCVSTGIISAYFVELYPTSHRGTVAYIGLLVGRLSGFIGINVVGNVIFTHCHTTFYVWPILLFGTAVAAYFLPADK